MISFQSDINCRWFEWILDKILVGCFFKCVLYTGYQKFPTNINLHQHNTTPANLHAAKHYTKLNHTWQTVARHSCCKGAKDGVKVRLDVVLVRLACRTGWWVAWRFSWAPAGAVTAEEPPSYNDETGSSPSNIQGASKFKPVNDAHITLSWEYLPTSIQQQSSKLLHKYKKYVKV